jgi:hypothetical protein
LDSTQKIRRIAGVLCVLSAFIFAGGGLLVLFNNSWSDLILIPATVISTFLYLIMWNGKYKNLADQGAIGILINLIIIAWIVFL